MDSTFRTPQTFLFETFLNFSCCGRLAINPTHTHTDLLGSFCHKVQVFFLVAQFELFRDQFAQEGFFLLFTRHMEAVQKRKYGTVCMWPIFPREHRPLCVFFVVVCRLDITLTDFKQCVDFNCKFHTTSLKKSVFLCFLPHQHEVAKRYDFFRVGVDTQNQDENKNTQKLKCADYRSHFFRREVRLTFFFSWD